MNEVKDSNKYVVGSRQKMLKDIMKLEEELRIIPPHRESVDGKTDSWSDQEMARYRWLLQDWKSREGSGE